MKQTIWTLLWRRFWQSKWTLSRLFFSITILISVIVVPVLKGLLYVGQWLDEVPFMSLSNVGQVLMQNPIFTVILVITVLILLTVFISQLASYTIGFSAVHEGQRPTATSVMKTALHRLRQGGVGAWLLILFYGIVVLPFPMLAFHSQLTADLIIPQFVWPTITGTPWMLTLIWVLGLAALFFAIRFFYVLPEIMLAEHKAGLAIKNSWRKTSGAQGIKLALTLLAGSILVGLLTLIVFGLTWSAQYIVDWFAPFMVSSLTAVVTFTLATLIDIFFGIMSLQFIIGLMARDYQVVQLVDYATKPRHTKRVVGLILMIGALIQGAGPSLFFVVNTVSRPLVTLSHRGVDDGNGVQNTIPAMIDTVSHARPNFVEMDIRQTKDGKWVVMHDPNLAALTKGASDKSVSDLTLAEATKLTVYENGHQAKIPSFEEYAKSAERCNVKLLVEIKTERTNAPDLADSFLNQFQTTMDKNGWQMHSLNYSVVQRLKTLDKKLQVGMILPGDFIGAPVTKADFYTMEYSYLTQSQVDDLNERGKGIYAWTVNDSQGMVETYAKGVQGEITDDVSELKSVVQETHRAHVMHQKLGLYIVNILAN